MKILDNDYSRIFIADWRLRRKSAGFFRLPGNPFSGRFPLPATPAEDVVKSVPVFAAPVKACPLHQEQCH